MAWNPPADDEPWTPPETDLPEGYQGEVLQTIPAEVQPKSWVEAMFPRASQALASGEPWYSPRVGVASILDQASGPGRAVMALGRPQGEGFQEAMARTEAPEVIRDPGFTVGNRFRVGGEGTSRTVENMVRDPATIPLSLTGGMAPAWLARMGWLGRGAVTGAGAGTTVAAINQGENFAAGRDLSARQALLDASIGTGFGLGAGLVGAGGRMAYDAATPAAMKLAKVGVKFREGVENALPTMMGRGILGWTVGGMERNAARMEGEINSMYEAAKRGTEGVPAVPLGMYADRAGMKVKSLADEAMVGPDDEAAAIEWIRSRGYRPAAAPGAPSPGMADVPTAIRARSQARKAAGSYESQAPTSSRREALQEAADEFASGINERIAQVAPQVRTVDEFAAPYFQFRPYMDALARRGNNYEIGLTELGSAGIGGALGSTAGGGGAGAGALGAALLARLQRSPALPYALQQGGRFGMGVAPTLRRAVPLISSATDNARGGR